MSGSGIETRSTDEIRSLLNPHFLDCLSRIPERVEIRRIPAKELLFHPDRFDLGIKYLYGRTLIEGLDVPFLREAYVAHVRLPDGRFYEEDGRKCSSHDYLEAYEALVRSLKERGFDPSTSIVPIREDGMPLDGAHRIAAAACLDQRITVAVFDGHHALGWRAYRNNPDLSTAQLDAVALLFCELAADMHVVSLWPAAEGRDDDVRMMLEHHGRVFYEKRMAPGPRGLAFLRRLAGGVSTRSVPSEGDPSRGDHRSRSWLAGGEDLRIFLFRCGVERDLRLATEAVRRIYGPREDAVQVTRSGDGARELARVLFDARGLDLDGAILPSWRGLVLRGREGLRIVGGHLGRAVRRLAPAGGPLRNMLLWCRASGGAIARRIRPLPQAAPSPGSASTRSHGETVVRIVKDWDSPDLLRQTPGGKGLWEGVRFELGGRGDCDLLVVLKRLPEDLSLRCRAGGLWLIKQEPPVKALDRHRMGHDQFDRVFLPGYESTHPGAEHSQPALPWHVDRSYDELRELDRPPPERKAGLSWVCSSADGLAGHCARLKILEALLASDVPFDHFGNGFRRVDDEFDPLFPYRYSLAVENHAGPFHWSEKISDCYLSWTVPIYHGCPDLEEHFPEESFIRLREPGDGAACVRQIRRILREDDWERRLPALGETRRLVLERYQLFPWIVERLTQAWSDAEEIRRHEVSLKAWSQPWLWPHPPFRERLLRRVRKLFAGR